MISVEKLETLRIAAMKIGEAERLLKDAQDAVDWEAVFKLDHLETFILGRAHAMAKIAQDNAQTARFGLEVFYENRIAEAVEVEESAST